MNYQIIYGAIVLTMYALAESVVNLLEKLL